MNRELEWTDQIITDGRLTTAGQEVQRKMAHFAVASARPFPQAIFSSKLVDEIIYDEGTRGRIECWTEDDDGAELSDLMRRAGFKTVRSFRRFTLTGQGFAASALQFWRTHVALEGASEDEDNSGHPPWTEEPEVQGDLRLLLRFLRITWFRPVRVVRPPYRVKRFFQTYWAKGMALEVKDGFALARKLKLREWKSDLEDDGEENSLRPVSGFIDFREAMSGDLLIEPRDVAGETHSTLIFEFRSEANDFIRRFTGHEPDRRRFFRFWR